MQKLMLIAALMLVSAQAPLHAKVLQPGPCPKGSVAAFVAHQDDDLLFVNPAISDAVAAGACVTVVHVIGGYSSSSSLGTFHYVTNREAAAKAAYERMTQSTGWTETVVTLAQHSVHRMALSGTQVVLVEMRITAGDARAPGNAPLALMIDAGTTVTTWPMADQTSAATTYNRTGLIATLRAIMKDVGATKILTLNPDTLPSKEHPDHIYVARAARLAAQGLGEVLPIQYHLTYPTSALPRNVAYAKIQDKRDISAAFFNIDYNDAYHAYQEYEWDGDWEARQYFTLASTASRLPESQSLPIQLVNDSSGRCLLDPKAVGASPAMVACKSAANTYWKFVPLKSVLPGQPANAQLVSEASGLCVAEQSGVLAEAVCSATDLTQRWTPWDFGIVYTPSFGCLGEANGAPAIGACDGTTTVTDTRFRWTHTQLSNWEDTRLSGAMFGNVTGSGTTAVYVTRIDGQPGFDVRVADMVAGTDNLWYHNSVPLNLANTSVPLCPTGTLCFDSSRFLVGDFDGDGLDDLMVVQPYRGGAGFWLMHSTGTSFAPPVLWAQLDAAYQPDLAQQYVASDFTGDGRTDIAIVHQRADSGFNVWVLANTGRGFAAPSDWLEAPNFGPAARFLPARFGSRAPAGLLVADDVAGGLAITQLASTGAGFRPAATQLVPAVTPESAKFVAADLDKDGVTDLVLLRPRTDSSDVDVFMMHGGATLSAPRRIGTLAASTAAPWNDLTAFTVARAGLPPLLALMTRVPAQADTQPLVHWTAGGIQLKTFPMTASTLGTTPSTSQPLTGAFTEALWRDRLN